MIKQIEKSICIEPEFLSSGIKKALISKVMDTCIGKCTKEDGYIIKIHSILGITDNYISPSTTSIIFKIRLKAEVLKPEIGSIFEGVITKIIPQGLFLCVQDKLNIHIPLAQMSGYEYDKKGVLKNGTNVINVGENITTNITAIRYEKFTFNCIGGFNK